MKIVVALSYFHRKIGPINIYTYPEFGLEQDLLVRMANIMDQTFNEGFFSHSFENTYSMNYYFEIPSDWARGGRDMLMVSVIFDQQTTIDIEQNLSQLLSDFAKALQVNEEIYAAFYINDLSNYEEFKEQIIENHELMKVYIQDLFRTVKEDTREKSEEEIIASLLSRNHMFLTLKKLSKGPMTLEALSEWFHNTFVHKDFNEMIEVLVENKFIFKNKIGWTTFILLLKEVTAERIPPLSIIENFDENDELNDLLLPQILDFFNMHEKKTEEELYEDSYQIFQVISDPKKYNILSKLRDGWIPKDKLHDLIPKRNLDSLTKIIDYLKNHDFIEEIRQNGKDNIVLKTNFQITTDFPKYLRKLLKGEEGAPVIANRYMPSKEDLGKNDKQQKREEMAELFKDLGNKGVQQPKEKKIQTFLTDLSSNPKKKDGKKD